MTGEPILVVDDNPTNLKLAQVLLATEGYDVRTAVDAPAALAALERFRPALILMDLQLPGMDGFELARRLKADPKTREIVVIALTAFAMKGDEEKARAAGCDGYIAKPIDTRRLPGVIARHIAAARAADSRARPGRTVLVVEDNPTTRKLVRLSLETAGYRVDEAPDGRTALERMAAGGVDLVLQDLLLPDMDGFQLLERLRRTPAGAGIPVLAFSGLISKIEEARATAVGFTGFLVKPVAPSSLIDAVRSHLPLAAESDAPRGEGRAVVIADDDPIQLSLLRLRLAEIGFRVTAVASGAEALEEIRRAPPAALVSDVLMPRLDGFGLCLELRRDPALAAIPVVLVSPVPVDEQDGGLARGVGASAIVLGAGDRRELIEALFDALRRPAPAPEGALALVEEERAHRLIRHLERQVAAAAGLAQRSTLQAAEIAILAGIAEALTRAQDVEAVLAEVLARCLDAGDLTAGALFVRGASDHVVRLRAQSGFEADTAARLPSLVEHEPALARALAGEPVALAPGRGDAAAEALLRSLGAESAIAVPVAWRDAQLGALLVVSRAKDVTEPEPTHFVRAVAGQIGQAIALARTFAQAQDAIRVRDEFLSIASHELKTPVTSLQLEVQGLIRTAAREALPPERLTGRLQIVERQLRRVTRLIDELLELSRLTSGPLQLELEPVDLDELVRDVVARFEHEIERSRSAVEVAAPAGDVAGSWDHLRLDQVVTNLLSNALKYGGGRPITLATEAAGERVRLVVRDQGIGISPADQARVFERFERAASTRHYGGFGLGLWIVRKLAEALGGTVTLESRPGEGSTFTVELPRAPAVPPRTATDEPSG